MYKSKIAILLTVLLVSVSFAGCGTPAQPSAAPAAPAAPATPAPSAPAPAAPAAPADPAPAAGGDAVYEAAFDYFKNFPSDKNVIAPADFLPMTDKGDEMFVLDIRRPDDYAKGHVMGAVNLSFFDTSISDNLEKLPDDKPIMVYCYTGQTASQVTALLNIAGKMAKNVQSGYNNGISKADGFEAYIDTTDVPLPDGSYKVDSDIAAAISAYFADKMKNDGGAFANFNIAPKDVKTILDDKNDDYLILSIRRAEDFDKGHIDTAINIPYGQGMQDELAKLPKDKQIVVYCYSGQTSSQTTAVLRMMGYDAYSMSGGMGNTDPASGWLGEGNEVVAS